MALNYAVDQYRQVKVQTGVQTATPHRLVAMLFEGVLEKIAGARLRITHKGSIAEKCQLLSGAIAIIDTLRASLDKEVGGEIAANLESLYEYMEHRLIEANLYNDVATLDEVSTLVRSIAEAWNTIAPPVAAVPPPAPQPRVALSIGA